MCVAGVFNLVKYGAASFKALSPHYIYYFWSVSGMQGGWLMLECDWLCAEGRAALQ